ncbi:hypothetical protein BKA65DRAFT_564015 [Rhexocercosporidium sp. MPI-PUGE-AT-0058]|nr:hypothetical protein BKA65DRAFT_564015 [Rhexocercosporidium sp. MPI-PUGE-AT-0058]
MDTLLLRRLLGLLLLAVTVIAQVGFEMTGQINALTFRTGNALTGGSLTLDGIKINIPDNCLVTLPAITVSWQELSAAGALPGFGSPGVTWSATVQGNVVGGAYVAGLVFIAQNPGQILAVTSANGPLDCVINSPTGFYSGIPYTAAPLWTADPNNPSIHAQSGFPVCIPTTANTIDCPAKNRPTVGGVPSTSFTFGAPPVAPGAPDPMFMVPLAVGDFVTFTGTNVGGTLTINALTANLGIYTAPGTKPAYVNVEEAILGIGSARANVEVAETRAVAFTTDPSTTIQWFAMDVDPCDGTVTERNIMLLQPSQVAPLGRAIFRLGKTLITPATQQVGFRLSTGTITTGNGLTAGQFIQPIFNFVFPELLAFGDVPLTLNFESIPFLAQGSGPYIPGNPLATPPTTCLRVGQLTNPWPGAAAPVPTVCASPPVCSSVVSSALPSSTSTSASATATAAPDTILSASGVTSQTRGVITLTVNAQVNNPNSILSVSVQGPSPISKQVMVKGTTVAGGVTNWSLAISIKGNKPTGITVTSSGGAAPVVKAVT